MPFTVIHFFCMRKKNTLREFFYINKTIFQYISVHILCLGQRKKWTKTKCVTILPAGNINILRVKNVFKSWWNPLQKMKICRGFAEDPFSFCLFINFSAPKAKPYFIAFYFALLSFFLFLNHRKSYKIFLYCEK